MIGKKIAHFEILDKLGEGGMGVVWKARDLNLERFVALKMLPVDRAGDGDRRQRLLQEARAASALNHPHIVTIHEIVREQDQDLIVMECVEGRALDSLIPRQGFRLNEALKIAIQVSDALAKAHQSGFVHRDLKPSNVMLTHDGRVKVLDFGLAKLTAAPQETDATATIQTGEGTVVGTAAYMSPEQAEGRPVDARSDIFAFGALLYEMLTGERAFRGDSRISTLAAVVRDQPKPVSELVPALPREVARIVERCLRKDPERRIQHMVDIKLALEDLREESESGRLSGPSGAVAASPAAGTNGKLMAGLGLAAVAIAALAAYRFWPGAAANPVSPPAAAPQVRVVTSYPGVETEPAVSPDGKQIAFIWDGGQGNERELYVKLIDTGSPLRLTNTPGARESTPRWSPDGRYVAFVRLGENQGYFVMPALGGPERKLLDLAQLAPHNVYPGIDWCADSKTLIAVDFRQSPWRLIQVSLDGADPVPVTNPPPNIDGDRDPAVSPDGKWMAYGRTFATNTVRLERVALPPSGKEQREELSEVRPYFGLYGWTPDGRELLLRGANSAVERFDVERRRSRPVEGLDYSSAWPSVSRDGKLVFARRVVDTNIWRVRAGAESKLERVIASDRLDSQPEYSPDGKRIAFLSGRGGTPQIWVADGDGSNAMVVSGDAVAPAAPRWSPDGKWVAFAARPSGNVDVYAAPSSGGPLRRLTQHPQEDASVRYSRDGKRIYFVSNRTGRREVWRKASDGTGEETQITKNGGWVSRESPDGQWLYYTKFGGGAGVFRMKLPGGGGAEEEKVIDAEPESAWAYENDFLFFADRGFNGYKKWDPKTGKVSVAAVLPFSPGRAAAGLSVTPDGQWLLFSKVDADVSEILMIEGFK